MKSFFSYAKNRFLYNLLRLLIVFGLGLIASQFLFIPKVYALPTGEVWSESATNKYQLGSFLWSYGDFPLYGLNGDGSFSYSPKLDTFYNGQNSLFTYDGNVNLNNTRGGYAIRFYLNKTLMSGNTYDVNIKFGGNTNDLTYYFSNPSDIDGTTLNQKAFTCSNNICTLTMNVKANSNLSIVYVNFNNPGDGLNGYYANQIIQELYFPQIQSTSSFDTSGIEDRQDQIIDQNQTIIDQNNESEKTRKGILATIKDVVSYINPLSENFFVYKLIELLIDAIKSLFIPEDGFFEEWFDEFMDFVELKLGFLATPFTLFIDFVESYLELDSSADVVINIPDISVPNFEDNILIHATTFNWSETLRSKESLNSLWQLYLDFIDVFLILNFIGLCERVYNRIFGGDTSNYEYYTVEDSYTYDNETGEVLSSRRNERTTKRKKSDS